MGQLDFTTGVDTTNQLAGLKVDAEDISFTLEEVATATTLTADHYLVFVNTSDTNITITLPAIADHPNRVYTIKNIGSGKVTIVGDIEWGDNLILGLQGDVVDLTTSGAEINDTDWFIIGGQNVKMEDLLRNTQKAQETLLETLRKQLDGMWKCLSSMSSLNNYKEDK